MTMHLPTVSHAPGRLLVAIVAAAVIVVLGALLPVSPASADTTYAISGHVSLGVSTTPAGDDQVRVWINYPVGAPTQTSVDSNGDYTLAGLPAGAYQLFFLYRGPEFSSEWWGNVPNGGDLTNSSILVGPGQNSTSKNITLPAAQMVTGHIFLGSTGTPAGAGVTVNLSYGAGPLDVLRGPSVLQTDANGSFSLLMRAGQYTFTFCPPSDSYQCDVSVSVAIGPSTTSFNEVLRRMGSITGHVKLGANGVSATSGQVSVTYSCIAASNQVIYSDQCGSGVPPKVYTDASGNYTIGGIHTAGSYTLSFADATGSTYQPRLYTIQITDTTSTSHVDDVTLLTAGSVSGTVSLGNTGNHAGAGRVQVTLACNADYDTGSGVTTTTDAQGHYQFSGVSSALCSLVFLDLLGQYAGGNWSSQAGTSGFPAYRQPYQGSPTSNQFSVETGPISGMDVTLPTGAFISGAVVTSDGMPLTSSVAPDQIVLENAQRDQLLTSSTNDDGTYTLGPLLPGTYMVKFTSNAIMTPLQATWVGATVVDPGHVRTLDVVAGQHVTDADAVQFRNSSLSLSVTCTNCGSNLTSLAAVFVQRHDVASSSWAEVDPDPAGSGFYWPQIPPGEYRAVAQLRSGGTIVAQGDPFTISEGQTATASLTVTLPSPHGPVNTVAPSVSGSASVGSTWTVNTGTWAGFPAPTIGIYWLRCTSRVVSTFSTAPSGCAAITSANSATYVATAADAGKYLTAQVVGTNASGWSLAGAVSTTPIASALPANTVAPSVSGSAAVGSTWTVNPGSWTGSPSPVISIYWLRCTQPISATFQTAPAGCAAISGANGGSYTATTADAGKYLTAQLAGTNAFGWSLAGAPSTTPIASALPLNTVSPSVSGAGSVGSTWTVNTGTWTGSPTPTIGIYWLRCSNPVVSTFTTAPSGCAAISGANSMSYVAVAADAGKYLTAQLAGTNSSGWSLAGAANTTPIASTVPVNTVAPSVSGSASVGSTWTVNIGTWTGSPAPTIAIYWLRCSGPVAAKFATVPTGCSAISGANSTTYVTTAMDAGRYLTAQLAGTNASGWSLAGAVSTTPIASALPANTVAPSVSGSAAVGSTWTVNPGSWTGSPSPVISIYWLRCNNPVASPFTTVPIGCLAIAGANSASYVATAADAGKYLTAQLAGTNASGWSLAGAISVTPIASP